MKNRKTAVGLYFTLLLLLSACASQGEPDPGQSAPPGGGDFGPLTLYESSAENERAPGVLYPRAIRLEHNGDNNGRLYATFEHYMLEKPSFPIYESADGGETWTLISEVEDQKNGWGMRYQPQLFELPEPIGDMPEGTVLCAGLSFPDDESECRIELYKSSDQCRTWTFVGTIAVGGRLSIDGSSDPIWEPFFLTDNGTLICYYSDSRDRSHSQKLVYQSSQDGINWGEVTETVAPDPFSQRPGMSTLARLGDGRYIMTYEIVNPTSNYVYYKISDDPYAWDPSDEGTKIVADDGSMPRGTPYVIWLDDGSENGTIVVSGWDQSDLFINRQGGDPDGWERMDAVIENAYSRSLCPLADGKSFLILGACTVVGTLNSVEYGRMSLPE